MSETSKRTKAWKAWTSGEEDTLVALRKEGITLYEIAERMGRTYRSIAKQVERMGRVAKKKSRLMTYYDALQVIHTLPGVAEQLGVKSDTVTQAKWLLRKKGFSVGPARRSASLMIDKDGVNKVCQERRK